MRPHPDSEKITRGVGRALHLVSFWTGTIYRSTTERYASSEDLVSGAGAKITGARWNPPGLFPAIYGSLTPEIAMAETLEHARYYGVRPWTLMRRVFCAVEVELFRVLDLTAGEARRRLVVSQARMLAEDWRRQMDAGEEALTQAIGRAVFSAGIEGLLVPSAALRGGTNMVVCPTNLEPQSRVREVKATS